MSQGPNHGAKTRQRVTLLPSQRLKLKGRQHKSSPAVQLQHWRVDMWFIAFGTPTALLRGCPSRNSSHQLAQGSKIIMKNHIFCEMGLTLDPCFLSESHRFWTPCQTGCSFQVGFTWPRLQTWDGGCQCLHTTKPLFPDVLTNTDVAKESLQDISI